MLESKKPLKQAITIYIDMHGTDDIKRRLTNPSPEFTHTYVSTIGKLGCLNTFEETKNDEEYCQIIKKYKDIFQGKTICESNKILEQLNIKNRFEDIQENQDDILVIKETYPNDTECHAIKYHQSHVPSANKTRVLGHERTYSCCVPSTNFLEYEKKTMGIYVIETYNVRNPIIKEIFDELKSSDINCLLLNICKYETIKNIYDTLERKKNEIPDISGDISSIIENLYYADIKFEPLLNETEFAQKHAGKVPMPEHDFFQHLLIEILDENLDEMNNYKIQQITLSDILLFLFIFGFEHVNIIDDSCRFVSEDKSSDDEFSQDSDSEDECSEGNCPNFMNPYHPDYQRIRSHSLVEKASGDEFLRANPRLGGTKRKRKTKKIYKRKTKKIYKRKTPTMKELQGLLEKYNLTRSGSKTEVAKRIYSLRSLYLTKKERIMLEDFLHISNNKKETRTRKPLPN
jgi:hypothetical protein